MPAGAAAGPGLGSRPEHHGIASLSSPDPGRRTRYSGAPDFTRALASDPDLARDLDRQAPLAADGDIFTSGGEKLAAAPLEGALDDFTNADLAPTQPSPAAA